MRGHPAIRQKSKITIRKASIKGTKKRLPPTALPSRPGRRKSSPNPAQRVVQSPRTKSGEIGVAKSDQPYPIAKRNAASGPGFGFPETPTTAIRQIAPPAKPQTARTQNKASSACTSHIVPIPGRNNDRSGAASTRAGSITRQAAVRNASQTGMLGAVSHPPVSPESVSRRLAVTARESGKKRSSKPQPARRKIKPSAAKRSFR